jgi:hypothetical protein
LVDDVVPTINYPSNHPKTLNFAKQGQPHFAMTSSASSTENASKKRDLKPEPNDCNTDTPPSPDTPSEKANSTPKSSPTKAKADAWTPELRLKLFEAYQVCSQTKREEVAEKVRLYTPRAERWLTRRLEMGKGRKNVGSNGSELLEKGSKLHWRRRTR